MIPNTMNSLVRLHITVSGRVQGVGYRYFARETARGYGLTGWVINCIDGSVELEVQGLQPEVDKYKQKLKQGPFGAAVTTLFFREIPLCESTEDTFEIRFCI